MDVARSVAYVLGLALAVVSVGMLLYPSGVARIVPFALLATALALVAGAGAVGQARAVPADVEERN